MPEHLHIDREISLLYDHSLPEEDPSESVDTILAIISEAFPDNNDNNNDSDNNGEESSEKAKRPELFTKMVHALRKLNYNELFSFYMTLESGEEKSFALDAVPLLKTDAGVQFMREWLISGELSQKEKDAWFATLTYYKSPTKLMIEVLTVSSSSNYISGYDTKM